MITYGGVIINLVHYDNGLIGLLCESEVLSRCCIDECDVNHMCDLI